MVNAINEKIVCCIVARTNSTRLPHKVLREVSGRRMIEHIIDRMKKVNDVSEVYIATSSHPDDRILSEIASENSVKAYQGSELSVIDRLLDIAEIESADFVIRVTGDNIYTDSRLLELLIQKVVQMNADYGRVEGAPIGVTAEVMRVSALKQCLSFMEPEHSEYLMLYMFDPDRFKTVVIDVSEWVPAFSSLTVDTPEDWERTRFIQSRIGGENAITLSDIVNLSKISEIPHFFLDSEAPVKLPNSKVVSLGQFMERQSALARKSQTHMPLSQKEYDDA